MLRLSWLAAVIVACGFVMFITIAGAQEHRHPPKDMPLHEKFYSGWARPDQPGVSCCSNLDCYPTPARMLPNGQWIALRREDQQWIPIPDEKIERNRDNPDGQSHLCAYPKGPAICFIPGGGT
jgi:hypothetical protein